MIYVGIDPGNSGAVAWLDNGAPHATPLKNLTERDIFDLLDDLESPTLCAIEHVHSMPRQGVSSSFKFGMSYGSLRMAVIAAKIPLISVSPSKWMGDLNCRTKGDKNVTKRKAQELYPQLKITHAIADALLIATWASRQ